MTQEEKYRKALLEARAVLEPCLKYSRGKVREALDSIDKELKSFESEDERIRKWLVNHFRQLSCQEVGGIAVDDIIAYLEKQKDLDKMIVVSPEVWDNAISDAFENGKKEGEKQKEQKSNIEICPHSIKSKSYKENGYPIGDCDYGLEIAYDILEKTFGEVRGYQTDDGIREHQTAIEAVRKAKEQKPDTRDADDLQLLGFIYDLLNEIEWKDNWAMSKDECLRRLNNYRPQKPAEWSPTKEQMVALSWAANGMLDNDSPSAGDIKASLRSLYNDLKSKSIRPAEWSDEDEAMRDNILRLLSCFVGTSECDSNPSLSSSYPTYLREIAWLKSLRPSWKPSEEQMAALRRAVNKLAKTDVADSVRLSILCDNLNKLI